MQNNLLHYPKSVAGRAFRSDSAQQVIARAFHLAYYHATDTWKRNTFLGYPVQQCPLDLHTYQELIARLRPNFILQTGVSRGGSLLYFATLLDATGAPPSAVVVGVDISLTDLARTLTHPRIRLVEGDSVDPEVVRQVRELLPVAGGLVILDSDHSQKHVSAEIQAYKDFVDLGSFLVVEDTNLNGHPVFPDFGPGPMEAVEEFLATSGDFVQDDEVWKRQRLSFHHGGWLRRVR